MKRQCLINGLEIMHEELNSVLILRSIEII